MDYNELEDNENKLEEIVKSIGKGIVKYSIRYSTYIAINAMPLATKESLVEKLFRSRLAKYMPSKFDVRYAVGYPCKNDMRMISPLSAISAFLEIPLILVGGTYLGYKCGSAGWGAGIGYVSSPINAIARFGGAGFLPFELIYIPYFLLKKENGDDYK